MENEWRMSHSLIELIVSALITNFKEYFRKKPLFHIFLIRL